MDLFKSAILKKYKVAFDREITQGEVHKKNVDKTVDSFFSDMCVAIRQFTTMSDDYKDQLIQKYTPENSTIRIDAVQEGDKVLISVSDDGPGVPDSEKGKIFDMFYTGSNGVSDGRRSLGFGLALCKTIVQAHGGTITLTDNQPHGSVFTFSLPAEEVPGDG